MLAQRYPRAGGVQQADGFVRQLPRRQMAQRQMHRRLQRRLADLDAVVLRKMRGDGAHHVYRILFVGFRNQHVLETARQRGVRLDELFVFRPGRRRHHAQRPPGQHRFQQVDGVAGAGLPAGAHQRMRLVAKQDHRHRRMRDGVDQRFQARFEFAPHARPGLHAPQIQRQQPGALQQRRHLPLGYLAGQRFRHRRFADPGFANQNRVVLPATQQDIDHLAQLRFAANHRVDFTVARLAGQIGAPFIENIDRLGRLRRIAVGAVDLFFLFLMLDGLRQNRRIIVEQLRDRQFFELVAQPVQAALQRGILQNADQDMNGAHPAGRRFGELAHQQPSFHHRFQLRRQIHHRIRPVRQGMKNAIQRIADALTVDSVVRQDHRQVAAFLVHQDFQPVFQLHVFVPEGSAQLGRFDERLIGKVAQSRKKTFSLIHLKFPYIKLLIDKPAA
ncbi:Protein of uncharacterised function (DUF3170) [Acinetobacter baumannii]|nr:Protein of uncharacterised function (DUF3170) [Acinetobacter baumannii]